MNLQPLTIARVWRPLIVLEAATDCKNQEDPEKVTFGVSVVFFPSSSLKSFEYKLILE